VLGVEDRLEPGEPLQRRAGARAIVARDVADRHDLGVEVAAVARGSG
jgi:hypothetical protein